MLNRVQTARAVRNLAALGLIMTLAFVAQARAGSDSSTGLRGGALRGPGEGGTLIVLNKSEATVSILDRESGSELGKLPTGVGPHEATVSPDGSTAVIADYGEQDAGHTLTVIDLESLTVSKTIDLGEPCRPHGIQFEPDGVHVVVTAETLGEILRVNIESGQVVARAQTEQRASHMLVLSPDGRRAFVSNIASGSVSVISVKTRELIRVIETGAGAEGIDITPDGKEVWVGNRANDTVTVIDAATLKVVEQIECAKFPIRVKVTPDGERVLVSCAQSGDVVVFDRETREELARIAMSDEPQESDANGNVFTQGPVPIGILIPADGTQAYIANTNVDRITVIDLETLKITGRLTAGKTPDGMAWSPIEPKSD